jgi:hypothetical protein
MNNPILLLVLLLIIAVDVWSVYRSDWLLFGMNTAIGVSLLIGQRKSETAQRLQTVLFMSAAVVGVIRLARLLI